MDFQNGMCDANSENSVQLKWFWLLWCRSPYPLKINMCVCVCVPWKNVRNVHSAVLVGCRCPMADANDGKVFVRPTLAMTVMGICNTAKKCSLSQTGLTVEWNAMTKANVRPGTFALTYFYMCWVYSYRIAYRTHTRARSHNKCHTKLCH